MARTCWLGIVLASLGAASACAAGTDPELAAGFAPPPPGDGEVQYLSPIVRDIQPGEDRIVCSYLDAYVRDDVDVADVAGFTTPGSHHVILYTTSLAQPASTYPCQDEEMVFLRIVGGTGLDTAVTTDTALPKGMVRRVRGGNQVVIQSHWFNAGDEPIDGQAAFNVKFEPVSPSRTATDFLAVMNTVFEVTPGTSKASVECTFQDTANIWQLAGHMHELGTHVRIAFTHARGGERVLLDEAWNREWFAPRFLDFTGAPMEVHPGDRLSVECEWTNPHPYTVRFPSEMCGAVGQFFPANGRLVCLNGDWLGD